MRKTCFLLLLLIFVVPCSSEQSISVPVPSKWIVHAPIFAAGEKGTFDDIAVKDPTIVNYEGKWHLFYTVSGKDPGGIGYASAKSLELLATAPHHHLTQFHGHTSDSMGGAPQVLYFAPQKMWYLIYQTKDFNRQPVYSTTRTIDKPETWSKTKNLMPRAEPDVKWIDFWVICDDTKAYFFYSRGRKDVYVRSTKIEDFPNGFGPGQLAFSPMPEPLTEAVHIYKVKDKKQYHMLYETRPPGQEMRRYGMAAAEHLLGPWFRVADDYAIANKFLFPVDVERWTDQISHGEMIRTGYDQKLEYDPAGVGFLMQGRPVEEPRKKSWQLGIVKACFNCPE